MATTDFEATVRALLDKDAIRDLARRYAHCVWRKDVEGAVQLFADDGVMDTGDRPPIRGRAALHAENQKLITGPDFLPFVHNHLVDLRGDTATGVCYLDLRATMDGRSMIGAGYYQDEYVRIDGTWKFRSRTLRLVHFAPLREGWAEQPARP
jgi:ketosteroid isomerase-like protein